MAERTRGNLPHIFRMLSRSARYAPAGAALTKGLRRLAGRRPEVFDRLGEFRNATFLIAPSDLDVAFRLVADGERASVETIAAGAEPVCDVTVRGPLLALLGLLDGTLDGDALFFDRTISVSGRTDALLALRNALEDAELTPAEVAGVPERLTSLANRSAYAAIGLARRLTSLIDGEPAR